MIGETAEDLREDSLLGSESEGFTLDLARR